MSKSTTLKELIKNGNCTQTKLANEMQKMKCYKYQQQISEWINGVRLPDAYSIWCLSKILNVSADDVLEACLKSAGVL